MHGLMRGKRAKPSNLLYEYYRTMEFGVGPRLLGFQKKNEIRIQEDK